MRFAFYGRLSTDDRQDVTLARPSQYEACERKVAAQGEITCEFFDQESGAHADRPELNNLLAEARDKQNRRFDRVVIFQTSRLARDRVDAALFERKLKRRGVPISYVKGGDSEIEIGIHQAIDQHMRSHLKEETRRGMTQNALNGWRNGGRPAYGYALERLPHPVASRASQGDTKSRLVVDPDQAGTLAWIFERWAVAEWGLVRIADDLNARKVPSPAHVDSARNTHGHWSYSTIRSILKNPVYLGRMTWDKLDFATARESRNEDDDDGPIVKRRDESEWVRSEVEHPALVSDELWSLAQERFRKPKSSGLPRRKRAVPGNKNSPMLTRTPHLLSGMVKCCTGHPERATYGAVMKGKTYYRCDYSRGYGKAAAEQIEGHGVLCSTREDVLLPLIFDFFDRRVFGPTRIDLLNEQLASQGQHQKDAARKERTKLERAITDADTAIDKQVRSTEEGVPARVVTKRIKELEIEQEAAKAALAQLGPAVTDDTGSFAIQLDRIPDLSGLMRSATPDVLRALFESFNLRVAYDKQNGSIRISATITEAMADALGTEEIPSAPVAVGGIAGACVVSDGDRVQEDYPLAA
jgi:site-specific DNA recombinase